MNRLQLHKILHFTSTFPYTNALKYAAWLARRVFFPLTTDAYGNVKIQLTK